MLLAALCSNDESLDSGNTTSREPTISQWTGYHMVNTDKWYFAYTIDGDTITVVDGCHAQNMHEEI